MAGVSVLS